MNAIFLYSNAPGSGRIVNKIDFIRSRLEDIFDHVNIAYANNIDELDKLASLACAEYDVLVFAGGDGTFHRIVNAIAKEEKRPILGYISSGTLNDFGKNFGIDKRLNRSLNIIKKGKIQQFDIGVINDKRYFTFVSAIGTFSEISYATKRKRIQKFGKMAYYMNAVRDAVVPHSFSVKVHLGGEIKEHRVPFLMVLNSRYVGGFPINLRNSLDDGKFDVYLTKPGPFNGLLNYLFLKRRTAYYRIDEVTIDPIIDSPWCIDGEEGPKGQIHIKLLKKHLQIYTNR